MPHHTFAYDPNWMEGWQQRPPGDVLTTLPSTSTANVTVTHPQTTIEHIVPTDFVDVNGIIPQWMKGPPVAQENAAAAGVVPVLGIGGGGNGSGSGSGAVGGLGAITVSNG